MRQLAPVKCKSLLLLLGFGAVLGCLLMSRSPADEMDGELLRRIRSDVQLSGYYSLLGEGGKSLIGKLDELTRESGVMPSRSDTISVLVASKIRLTGNDKLWFPFLLMRLQKPELTKDAAMALYDAFSKTLPPMNSKFHVMLSSHAGDEQQSTSDVLRIDYEYSCDANGVIYLKRIGGGTDPNLLSTALIFNGVELQEVDFVREGFSNESVTVPTSLRKLFPEHHPLSAARLAPIDGAQDPHVLQDSGYLVFGVDSGIVFETPEDVNGKPCTVYGFLDWAIALDPELNFAVVEERYGDVAVNGGYSRRPLHYHRRNSDFVAVSEDIFLPQKSVLERRVGGRLVERAETVVDSLEVRPAVSLESLYERPKKLAVLDHVRGGIVLPAGMDHLEPDDKRGGTYALLLVNMLVVLVVVSFLVVRRKKNAKRLV